MTTITEPTKRHKLTQEDCDIARFFTKRRMKLKEIGKIIGVDPSTVGKIQKADFRLEKYLEQRKEMNRKTAERKAADAAGARRLNELLEPMADDERDQKVLDQLIREEQAAGRWHKTPPKAEHLMGQMQMDLEPEKDPSPAAHDDSAKLMKFQAAMMDKLLKKLDELIDALTRGRQ